MTVGLLGLVVPAASAKTYVVNELGDATDAATNEVCDSVAGGSEQCTLRAAIEESNASTGVVDLIGFDGTIFNGEPADTIALGSGLPPITNQVTINGSSCLAAGAPISPCVGVNGPTTEAALTIENTDNVTINGLSITGGQFGIDVIDSSQAFTATNDWIGVKLDGSAAGSLAAGIFIDPDSNGAHIGGSNLADRNVISNNGTGLDILGADNAVIQGNFFGVKPDGQTAAGNTNKDIEITDSTAGAGFKAENNEIGRQLSPGAPPTLECDEGCNVISGSQYGIDLNGNGSALQEEAPASGPTVIHSNYIGLNAGGLGALPNTNYGIMVGAANKATIGGPSVSSAAVNVNRIAGGEYGIFAAEGDDLKVELNAIGTNAIGGEVTPPSAVGIFDLALGVTEPAVIALNSVRMVGGVGIEQGFTGSQITSNSIVGGEFGIRTMVSGGEGSLIEGNGIEGAERNGILIEDDGNEVLGNFVRESGAAGIRIQTPLNEGLLPSSGNLIGGPFADENSIYENGGAAIEISDLEESDNEVGANSGLENAGPFVDLVSANPGTEPNGPNHGIKPPTISSATPSAMSGTALPGARVLVFRKATAAPGEIKSFIGEATADGSGAWKVEYEDQSEEPLTLPEGTNVAALQTGPSEGSSELALTIAETPKPEEKGSGGGGGGGSTNPADKAPPQTKITKGPKGKSSATSAKFKFTSTEAGSTFQCKLDHKPFKTCRSPKKYKRLRPGKHVFKVRATDPAGNTDPTPAVKKFTVLK
ncbi:MAG TPA: hypothetical protein VGF09_06700 [Solirubrobacterales bacterium]